MSSLLTANGVSMTVTSMLFQELLDHGDTIFICGEEEELRSETLDPLLASGIRHFYFIKPKANLRKYLADITDDPRLCSYVESLDEVDLTRKQIVACGFKPVARNVLATLRKYQPAGVIFFDRKLGIFRANWKAWPGVKIIEQGIAPYIAAQVAEFAQRALYKSSDLVDKDGEFFTNRGEMLDLHRDFINRKSQRCCKLVGLKGIGKRAFLRRLKFVMGLSENCFEIGFTDHTDDISYVLGQLLRKFGITYELSDLEQFCPQRVLPVVEKLLLAFDALKNAKIIFYRLDMVYDAPRRRFYDPQLEAFFHQLLQRESYRQNFNRVYLIANENFNFTAPEDRDVTYTIQLNPIHPEHVKYILEHEFNSRGKTESAQAIMRYDHETIHKLLGGHPQIAKLFVEACEHFPMASIINDPGFRKKFDDEKAAYLMQHIRLSAEETRMLQYLALFTTYFWFDAIRVMAPQPYTLIEQLRDKFLLEKEDFTDGHAEYYVPSIIQDYARANTDEATRQSLQNQIAQYYWGRAEDLKTPPPDALEAYRLALYHFAEANNSQQERNLAMYFKGIFLKKAQDAYHRKEYETAWHYYRELSEQSGLEPKDWLWYLICHARLGKPGVETLYAQALDRYPRDRFLKTAYAQYLAEQGDDARAQQLCAEVLAAFPDDHVAQKLAAKLAPDDPALSPVAERTPDAASAPLADAQRARWRQEHESLHAEYRVRQEKLDRLRQAHVIATDASERFRLEKQIEAEERDLAKLESKLAALEQKLGA